MKVLQLHAMKQELFRGLNPDQRKLKNFQNKVEIEITLGSYLVKTASTKREVIESLQLRHDVFYEEFLGKSQPTGLDIDRYDAFFDHLVVVDTKTGNVVATYRLYSSVFGEDFYSKSEFDLTDLKNTEGPFLEIGRACVHKDFRKSTVLACLWRGIAEYIKSSGCRTLMGCGSIKTEDPLEVAKLNAYFEKNQFVHPGVFCPPRAGFAMDLPQVAALSEEDEKRIAALIPPLFKSYLKAGCKLSRLPAWDHEFKCIDYLILLDTAQLPGIYEKRYF